MTCTYWAEIKYCLQLTHEEFAIIWRNAIAHYSYDVKGNTEQGGFIYGMNNVLSWHKKDLKTTPDKSLPSHNIESRNFQLLMKALEMDVSIEARGLFHGLKKAFDIKQKRQELANNYMEALEQEIF